MKLRNSARDKVYPGILRFQAEYSLSLSHIQLKHIETGMLEQAQTSETLAAVMDQKTTALQQRIDKVSWPARP